MAETAKPVDLQKLFIMLYGVYAASAVLQFFKQTLLLGLLALVIAYIVGNSKKVNTEGTPYASHLRWLNRTFWIGSGVIVPIAVVIAAFLICYLTDIFSILNTVQGGDWDDLMGAVQNYMQQNMAKISAITLITLAPTVIWWMRRCWIGYTLAKAKKPVENVTSWL
jgi:uncharacterized membrane protein